MDVAFGADDVRVAGPLMDGTCVRQSFVAAGTPFEAFLVFLGMRRNPEESYLTMDLLDSASRAVLRSATVRVTAAADSEEWREFPVGVGVVVGCRYEVMLRTMNCRAGMSPMVCCGRGGGNGYMFLGARLVRGCELRCRFVYGGAA